MKESHRTRSDADGGTRGFASWCRTSWNVLVLAAAGAALVATATTSSAAGEVQAVLISNQILLSPVCDDGMCDNYDHSCRRCAQPVTDGHAPMVSDALAVLRAAVGQALCTRCICDVDASGGVQATDALLTLRRAVGQPVDLSCPEG